MIPIRSPEFTYKILIINVHSDDNAGDAALLRMTVEILRDVFPQSFITIAADDPDSVSGGDCKVGSFIYWMHRVSSNKKMRWQFLTMIKMLLASICALLTYRLWGRPCLFGLQEAQKDTIKAYFDADFVVSKPGNFLYTSGNLGLTLMLSVYTMGYAILAGKPLYLFPQSIGPLQRKRDQKLVRWVLNRARIIMIRELISLEEIRKAGVKNSRCYLVPDLTFAFQGAPREEAIGFLRSLGIDIEIDRPLLGVTAINWNPRTANTHLQMRYEESLKAAIKYHLEKFGGKVVIFSHVCGKALVNDDRIPSRRIAERLGDNQRVILVDKLLPPELLKSMYGMMDIFIGTRMHSNIFALSEGVPVIAIAYLHKTWGVMRMMGLEEWVIDIEEINAPLLIAKLNKLWCEKEKIKQLIRSKVRRFAEETKMAGFYISSDFCS